MRRRVFRNNYKGHMDNYQGGGWKQGREVGLDGEVGGQKMQTTVIEQQ